MLFQRPGCMNSSERPTLRWATALTAAGVLATFASAPRLASAQLLPIVPVLAAQQEGLDSEELLRQGLEQYQNKQYEEAQASLQQANPEMLSPADRRKLSDTLAKLESAVNQRKAARAEFEMGEEALAQNRFAEAIAHYKAAAQNRFADEGTRRKAGEQIALAEAGRENMAAAMRTLYSEAVADYKSGNLAEARPKFESLHAAGFKTGLFQKSPRDYIREIDRKMPAVTPQPEAPAVAEAAPKQPEPAQPDAEPMAPPTDVATTQTPEQRQQDAKAAYAAGREALGKNELGAARDHFARARDLGYKPGWFEDSPDKYLQKIDRAMQQQAETQARAAEEQARRDQAAAPAPRPDTPMDREARARLEADRKARARSLYDQARRQYSAGDLSAARDNFAKAQELDFKPGFFEDSPAKYLARIDAQMRQQAEAGAPPTPEPAPEVAPEPAPAMTAAQRRREAKSAYDQGRDAYKNGDLPAAREQFAKAKELGYKPGWFQDSPDKYLARIDTTLQQQADAQARRDAEAQAQAQREAQEKARAEAETQAAREAAAQAQEKVRMEEQARRQAAAQAEREVQAKAQAQREAAEKARMEAQARREAEAARAEREAQEKARMEPERVVKPAPADEPPQPILPEPEPTDVAAQPQPAAEDARAVYLLAREQYRKGDWVAARQSFLRAQDLNFEPRLFEDSPATYLRRMDRKEQADAARSAQQAQASDVAPEQVGATTEAEQELERTAQMERIRRQQRAYEAQQLVEQARGFQSENRLAEALEQYNRAVQLDPTNDAAVAGRNEMLILTGRAAEPSPLLTEQERRIRARRQAIEYSFQTSIEEASAATSAGDFRRAQSALETARVARGSDPNIFTPAEIAEFDAQLAAASASLERAREELAAAERQRATEEAIGQEQVRLTQQQAERERTVATLIRNARRLVQEGRYREALGVIDQILVLEPNNDYAVGVRPLVEDRATIEEQRRYREEFDRQLTRQMNAAEEKKIPYDDILRYPPNWPDISEMRDRAFREGVGIAVEDQAVLRQLDAHLPEIRLDGVGFTDAIDFLRDISGVNIHVDWHAVENAGVDRNAPVTARLRDVPLSKALDVILASVSPPGDPSNRLAYAVDRGVLTITTANELRTTLSVTRLYDIRDLIIPPNDVDAQDLVRNVGGGGGRGGLGGGGGGQQGGLGGLGGLGGFGGGGGGGQGGRGGRGGREERREDVERAIEDIKLGIADTLIAGGDPLNRTKEEIAESLTVTFENKLIITETPENHRKIAKFLAEYRALIAGVQVQIETRFITVQRNFLDDIGFDVDFTFNQIDPRTGKRPISSRFGDITVNQNSIGLTEGPNTGVPGAIDASVPSLGISATFLDDFSARILLNATQASINSTVLAAPRLTLRNGDTAAINILTTFNVVSNLQPVVGSNVSSPSIQAVPVPSGILYQVTATVSADRKYVTLKLTPELTRLVRIDEFSFESVDETIGTGDDARTTTRRSTIQLPVIEQTIVDTTVNVPDGATLLLGGQTLAGEVEREAGVPILSKVPFLKRLFTNRSMSKDEQVLLILCKPTILISQEQEEQQFPLLRR